MKYLLQLQTKVPEDFTITWKSPTNSVLTFENKILRDSDRTVNVKEGKNVTIFTLEIEKVIVDCRNETMLQGYEA